MKTKLVIASAAGLLLLAGGAIAATHMTHDLTRAEAAGKAREHFARMDANKDGKLDAADRAAHHGEMAASMFDRVDADKNGAISRDEWNAGAAQLAAAHGRDDGPRHMLRMQRPAMHLMRADADGDRAVTAQEFEAQALARFDAADANKDGTVTAGERQAARGRPRPHGERD